MVVGTLTANSTDVYRQMLSAFIGDSPNFRSAFTTGVSEVSNLTLSVAFIKAFNSSDSVISPSQSLSAFDSVSAIPGVEPSIQGLQFPTWLQAYNGVVKPIVLTGDLVGVNLLLSSRILPEAQLNTGNAREALVDFFLSFPASQPIIMEWGKTTAMKLLNDGINHVTVGGVATQSVNQASVSIVVLNNGQYCIDYLLQTSIHPAWRSAAGYLAMPVFNPSSGPVTANQNATVVSINMAFDKVIGSAAYVNEDNKIDDNFQERFWGSNYARLLRIKKTVDSSGVFSCSRCVGSEVFGT